MAEPLEVHPSVVGHYATGVERDRFTAHAYTQLEWERTKAILRRALPDTGRIFDIGGGPGAYAAWLSDLGYDVELFDIVELHVEQALDTARRCRRPFTAELADARSVPRPDGSADVVLLLGPLYHLIEAVQRHRALTEALRLLRPGGLLVAAGVGRLAWLLDATRNNLIVDPEVRESVRYSVRTGVTSPAPGPEAFYAYLHRPEDLAAEVRAAGFPDVEVVAVEGVGYLLGDLEQRLDDETSSVALLDLLGEFGSDQASLEVSGHLLAIAVKP
jgi:SAM-dependent methyltransferase